MEIKVRRPNLENMATEGVPRDFTDIMDYFNTALKNNTLSWIPRKTPITVKEIKEKWIPSLKSNISLVAEINGKVVGSGTVFYDINSSSYEDANKRASGEFNSTANPEFDYKEITKELTKGIIKELISQGKKAHQYITMESPAIKAMEELGIKGQEETLPHYKKEDSSGKVMRYNLP